MAPTAAAPAAARLSVLLSALLTAIATTSGCIGLRWWRVFRRREEDSAGIDFEMDGLHGGKRGGSLSLVPEYAGHYAICRKRDAGV